MRVPGALGAAYRRLAMTYTTIPPAARTIACNHQDDHPRATHSRVLWFFGRWSASPGLRSIPVPERVDIGLRLIKEGGPTAYANSVSAVSIITVVTIDDVLFPRSGGNLPLESLPD